VAVKIKLKRMGKIREPYFRIVVADARTKRDGRAIEEIGKYHPKADPSLIEVDSDRAQHWLSVGAQPTDPVRKLLEVTGDWQRFKGLPGAEGTLKSPAPRSDKKEAFAAALAETLQEGGATTKAKGRAGGRATDAKAGDAKAGDAKATDAKAGDAKAGTKPSRARTERAEKGDKAEKPAKAEAKSDTNADAKAETASDAKAETATDAKAGAAKAAGSKSSSKSAATKSDDAKSDDAKSDDAKSDDAKSDDAKSGGAKAKASSSAKADEEKPQAQDASADGAAEGEAAAAESGSGD